MINQEILTGFVGLKFTEIEPSFPSFIFEGKLKLQVDCPWRVMHGNYIVAGNLDYRSKVYHEELLIEMREYLIGQTITAIEFTKEACDLNLKLDESTIIQLFPTSTKHEAWRFTWGEHYISAGLKERF